MRLFILLLTTLVTAGLTTGKTADVVEKPSAIVGSDRTDADAGEFPYIVYIQDRYNEKELIAMGVLVRPKVVLTSATPFLGEKAKRFKVVLGTWDRNATEETREEIRVAEIKIHYEYYNTYKTTLTGQLCLLRLESEPKGWLADRIKTIGVDNIISDPADDDDTHSNSSCITAGYGMTTKNEFEFIWPTVMQKYDVTVQDPAVCDGYFTGYNNNKWMCSYNPSGTSTCNGDLGAPLLCAEGGNTLKMHGFVGSMSYYCDDGKVRWVRLSSYHKWIKTVANNLQNRST